MLPPQSFKIHQRQCIFDDEKPDDFHDLYSYSACITRCRIKSVMSLCQCTPYFLPIGKEEGPICLLSDLPCLNKYKGSFNFLVIKYVVGM